MCKPCVCVVHMACHIADPSSTMETPKLVYGSESSSTSYEKDEEICTSEGSILPEDQERLPSHEFTFYLCALSAMDGADQMLLPAVFFALQSDIHLTLSELATLSLWQSLLLSLAAPVWGILADHGLLQRKTIVVCGCFGWGAITGLLAFVDSWTPMIALRALNGLMLACLRPTCNSLVADSTSDSNRGKLYGKIAASRDVGVMIVSFVATPLSTHPVLGLQGWRASFLVFCGLSAVLSLVLAVRMEEPPREVSTRNHEGSLLWQEACKMLDIFRTPTFLLIIAQGVFGIVPWTALGFMTLYFQTSGLSDVQAGILTSASKAAQGVGHLMGGYIGDFAARQSRYHGRPLVAQFSAVAGIPFLYLLFCGLPPDPAAFGWYLAILTGLGLTATWQLAGTNWPMFTEVVPPSSRSMVVAWDAVVEGCSGAIFGGPLVSALAQGCFGYDFKAAATQVASPENARALGQALAWVTCSPFMVCFLFYSATHWSYPRDLKLAHQRALEQTKRVEA